MTVQCPCKLISKPAGKQLLTKSSTVPVSQTTQKMRTPTVSRGVKNYHYYGCQEGVFRLMKVTQRDLVLACGIGLVEVSTYISCFALRILPLPPPPPLPFDENLVLACGIGLVGVVSTYTSWLALGILFFLFFLGRRVV